MVIINTPPLLLVKTLPRAALVGCAAFLMVACSSTDTSKAEACTAWEAHLAADKALSDLDLVEESNKSAVGGLPDTEAALKVMDEHMDETARTNDAVKKAFAKAAKDDPEWVKVHEAAYTEVTKGWGEEAAVVDAACDRLS